jgi:hypothetical protein
MNSITLPLKDLQTLLFSSYADDCPKAVAHWSRRLAAPITDKPSQLIPPTLVNIIQEADPEGAYFYIQTVTDKDLIYHRLWSIHDWHDSYEKRYQQLMRSCSEILKFNQEQEETATREKLLKEAQQAPRIHNMAAKMCTRIGKTEKYWERLLYSYWLKSDGDEAKFKVYVDYFESILGAGSIYIEPIQIT